MGEEREMELPPEWGGIIPSQIFLDEAGRIVEEAQRRDLVLRAMGGVGIRLHCLDYQDFATRIGRLGEGEQEFTDLDFMSYRKQRNQMKDLFESVGYVKRRATLSTAASERQIYFHSKGWFFVDVFFDKLLVANHPLDFRNRLELDFPTIPLGDLLLEKLQIVNFSEKDLKDTLTLLRAHRLEEREESDVVNIGRIAKLLSKDWGFYYTLTNNLKGVKAFLPKMTDLTEEEAQDLGSKIDMLLECIEREPKSMGWKMRAKIGARKMWYQPVETTETVGDFGVWRLLDKRERE
ncbi:MAG: hypothetical protein ACETV0_04505 [Nitrososphaeria archaeon]